MNTFQKLRLESESLFQRAKRFDASTEIQSAVGDYEQELHRFNIRLKVKMDNYDFDGAIAVLHEGMPEVERTVLRLKEAVAEVEHEDMNNDDVNIYNPMEDSDADAI
jgi:hypothetical protein